MTHPTGSPVASPWMAGPFGQTPIATHPARVHHPAPQWPVIWPVAPRDAPATVGPAPRTVSAAAGNPTYVAGLALLVTVLLIGIPLACYLGLAAA